jgi:hypothetical protein
MNLGVIEGFFGPAWPHSERLSYAPFLGKIPDSYYIYAPKQDPHLRKKWREVWDEAYLNFLSSMKDVFQREGVKFGVAISPFGLGETLKNEDAELLKRKISELDKLGIDLLGVFFDDMPVHGNLARVQAQVMDEIRLSFEGKIVFCPSFYCFDPILEKVFGKMPDHYLEDVADMIPSEIALAWTGPKVISPEISKEHLEQVGALLKRKPFIWENLFANDGPRNCKFLKLKPFTGRENGVDALAESWGLNMMNQPELSKIVFLASKYVLIDKMDPELAWEKSLERLVSPRLANFITGHAKLFLEEGLDKMSEEKKTKFLQDLSTFHEPAAVEIAAYLKGEYLVGSECLTD